MNKYNKISKDELSTSQPELYYMLRKDVVDSLIGKQMEILEMLNLEKKQEGSLKSSIKDAIYSHIFNCYRQIPVKTINIMKADGLQLYESQYKSLK